MIQPLFGILTTLAANNVFYIASSSVATGSASSGLRRTVWPAAGTFGNLVLVCDIAPGVGNSITVTLRYKGVNQTVTATVSGTDTTARFTGTPLAVTAGEIVEYRYTETGSPATVEIKATMEFNSTGNISCHTTNIDTQQTGFNGVFVDTQAVTVTSVIEQYVAVDGTFTALYGANTFGNVTGAGNELNFYMYKNGVKQDGTGGTVDTKCSVTLVNINVAVVKTFTLPVSRGDKVYIGSEEVGTYPNSWTTIGAQFTSTKANQSNLSGLSAGSVSASVVNFNRPTHPNTPGWGSSEQFGMILQASITPVSVGSLYAVIDTDPGAAPNARTLTLRKPSAASDTLVAGTFTTGVLTIDNSITAGFVDGDTLGFKHTPADTPVVTGTIKWTFIVDTSTPTPGVVLPIGDTELGISRGRRQTTLANNLLMNTLGDVGLPIRNYSVNPPRIRGGETLMIESSISINPAATDVLFKQNNWPNPLLGKRVNSDWLFWYAQLPTAQETVGAQFTSLPVRRVKPAPNTWINARPTYYTEPSGLPFSQKYWANPEGRKRSIVVTNSGSNPNQSPPGVIKPFNQTTWQNPPKKRSNIQKHEFYYMQEGTGPFPTAPQITALPPIRRKTQTNTWIRTPLLVVAIANLPAGKTSDVNPAIKKRQTLTQINPGLQLKEQPFSQTEWPNPRAIKYTPQITQERPFYYSEFEGVVFTQLNWPNPIIRRSTLLVDSSSVPAEEPELPPNSSWPNPTLKIKQANTWLINLLQTTLEPTPGEVPFNQIDYPNPLRAKVKNQDWLFYYIVDENQPPFFGGIFQNPLRQSVRNTGSTSDRPFYFEDPIQPNKQLDWPNPGLIKRPTLQWLQNALLGTLSPMPPISQIDWPNPLIARRNRVDFTNDVIRELTGTRPFNFTEWFVPKQGVINPFWTDNPILVLVTPEGIKPFNQNIWLPTPLFGVSRFNYDILNFIHNPNIIPDIQGRVICLDAALTVYALFAALDPLEFSADATDYNLEAGGSDCP